VKLKSSKLANEYLQEGGLGLILAKVKELDELSKRVNQYLDDHIKYSCQVANRQQNKLIMLTTSSSVATQIHLRTGDLLKKFQQDPILKSITQIQCKVRPQLSKKRGETGQKRTAQPPSQEAAAIMQTIADSLEDPKLRDALKRIAEAKK
jgi:hypothetical protein